MAYFVEWCPSNENAYEDAYEWWSRDTYEVASYTSGDTGLKQAAYSSFLWLFSSRDLEYKSGIYCVQFYQ